MVWEGLGLLASTPLEGKATNCTANEMMIVPACTTPRGRTHMRTSFSFFFYVCPISAQLQCSPHPFGNLSDFINVLWERALDLEYLIVQVKMEEKTF